MNTEEDEFKRIEAEAKRRAAVEDDDDTQTYTSESAEEYLYRFGYEDGAVAEREACEKICIAHGALGLAAAIRARSNT